MIKKDAKSIWGEYQRGRTYKSSVDLYENYKKNENFFTKNSNATMNKSLIYNTFPAVYINFCLKMN